MIKCFYTTKSHTSSERQTDLGIPFLIAKGAYTLTSAYSSRTYHRLMANQRTEPSVLTREPLEAKNYSAARFIISQVTWLT